VPGDAGGALPHLLQHPQRSDAGGQNGRLSIGGVVQRLRRSLKAETGEGKAQDLVGAGENPGRNGEPFGQLFPHPHPLGSLSGKLESRSVIHRKKKKTPIGG
jgi:hypothetical protein